MMKFQFHAHRASCSPSSFFSFASSRCLKSSLLLVVFLFSLVVPAAAEEGDPDIELLDVFDFRFRMYTLDGTTTRFYHNFSVTSDVMNYGNSNLDFVIYASENQEFDLSSVLKVMELTNDVYIKADTHYNLSFKHGSNTRNYDLEVFARIYQNQTITDKLIFSRNYKGDSFDPFIHTIDNSTDFDFILKSEDLGDNYKIKFMFIFSFLLNQDVPCFGIQQYIPLRDLDSNARWYQRIISAITALPDRIGMFFTQLGDRILDGLKSLFIPSDGYFDEKKVELETFITEHFGALYQAPDLMLDVIRKFTTMSPQAPGITLPAIQFELDDQLYTFSEPIHYSFSWVNDSSNALYYFYKFYRGFVTVSLFLSFCNYCIKKYNVVFGGGNPD